ncbi:hypothetical protein D3Z45_18400 [Lachnospiraceae bacterium]|nr:hypothetical protein [Lachnospiraceae bacterium]
MIISRFIFSSAMMPIVARLLYKKWGFINDCVAISLALISSSLDWSIRVVEWFSLAYIWSNASINALISA